MAKKKVNKSESLIRKVIALGAAVITFVFMFLETIAVKLVGKNIVTGEKVVDETEGVKISDFLFKEDYKQIREEFSTANTFLWIAFILVIVAVLVLVASLVLKNNDGLLAKVGAGALVLGLVLMFVINTDKVESAITTYFTNITALYFVALALSGAGLASVLGLKK